MVSRPRGSSWAEALTPLSSSRCRALAICQCRPRVPAPTRVTALSTQADGAIVLSAQTYVFAAGTAFALPAPGDLAQLRTTDAAAALTGTVGQAETDAPLASGVLLSVAGQGVYVTYQGQLFPFSSMAQLAAEGYGGTAAVPVPASVVASIPQA